MAKPDELQLDKLDRSEKLERKISRTIRTLDRLSFDKTFKTQGVNQEKSAEVYQNADKIKKIIETLIDELSKSDLCSQQIFQELESVTHSDNLIEITPLNQAGDNSSEQVTTLHIEKATNVLYLILQIKFD